MKQNIISTNYLAKHLENKNLVLLDSSPNKTISNLSSEYQNLAIPGARVFDLKEKFSDKTSKFPNTIPSKEQFEKACRLMGINADSEIQVYDNLGIYTSPRVWWLFNVMGHNNVKVLNGGLPKWINDNNQVVQKSSLKADYDLGDFRSEFKEECLVSYDDIIENLDSNNFLIVDARSAGRFNGTEPEPRKHIMSGSIPNSVNIPYKTVLENGKFKTTEALTKIFNSKLPKNKKLVFSCGSGITACIVMLAYELIGGKGKFLYDGSWTEYAELRNIKG